MEQLCHFYSSDSPIHAVIVSFAIQSATRCCLILCIACQYSKDNWSCRLWEEIQLGNGLTHCRGNVLKVHRLSFDKHAYADHCVY